MDPYVAAGGFGLDQVELVAGAVDQDDPVAPVLRVAGFGLGESGGDDLAYPFVALSGPGRLRVSRAGPCR